MICKKFKKTVAVTLKFLDDTLNNSLTIANQITNEVAKVIGNPLFQLLVSQLPAGIKTDVVLAKIEEVLQTTRTLSECENLTGIDKVNCLMQGLNILPKNERNSALLRLASALTALFDGNRYEQVVYDTAAQTNYLNEVIATGKPLKLDDTKTFPVKPVDAPVDVAVNALKVVHSTAQPVSSTPEAAASTPSSIAPVSTGAGDGTLMGMTANPLELKQQPVNVTEGVKANPFN